MTDYTPPTPAEVADAKRRADDLHAVMMDALRLQTAHAEAWQAALAEYLRLAALAVPARDYIVDKLTGSRPPAGVSHRTTTRPRSGRSWPTW